MDSAKGGIAKSMCPAVERVLSVKSPGFLLQKAAMGKEITRTKIKAMRLMPSVTGSLEAISSPTGCPNERDLPKSPLAASPSHEIYLVARGASRPSSSRRA